MLASGGLPAWQGVALLLGSLLLMVPDGLELVSLAGCAGLAVAMTRPVSSCWPAERCKWRRIRVRRLNIRDGAAGRSHHSSCNGELPMTVASRGGSVRWCHVRYRRQEPRGRAPACARGPNDSLAATTAGVLFIVGTLSGLLSKATIAGVSGAADPLNEAADHSGAVVTSALLVLVMGLSLALIPVVLFPVLRRIDEVLAVGYLVVRGAIETACYIVVAVGWLLLEPLHGVMSAGSQTASARLGDVLIDADGINGVLALVFCLGAAIFYVLLYRSRIVPRWIAGWGLGAIPLYLAGGLLGLYGVIGTDSAGANLLSAPLALQEMVLAVWMIARGFRPADPLTPRRADDLDLEPTWSVAASPRVARSSRGSPASRTSERLTRRSATPARAASETARRTSRIATPGTDPRQRRTPPSA